MQVRIVAIANPTGGVGKTTTAINLGAALAAIGEKVLILDLDPKGNASKGIGIDEKSSHLTSFDVMIGKASIMKASRNTKVTNLSLVPANANLVGLEAEIPFRLRHAISTFIKEQEVQPAIIPYTYLLIDCPPSDSQLTANALTAAQAALVPVQCEFFPLTGIYRFSQTIDQIKSTFNPALEIQGVVLTMYDVRAALSHEVGLDVRAFFGSKVYKTVIPRDLRVAEAPSAGKPIILYDYACAGSQAYIKLATEFVARDRGLPFPSAEAAKRVIDPIYRDLNSCTPPVTERGLAHLVSENIRIKHVIDPIYGDLNSYTLPVTERAPGQQPLWLVYPASAALVLAGTYMYIYGRGSIEAIAFIIIGLAWFAATFARSIRSSRI